MTQDHRPLAVDADGYVWRINDNGSHSMARTNPGNSPTPQPLSIHVPVEQVRAVAQALREKARATEAEGVSSGNRFLRGRAVGEAASAYAIEVTLPPGSEGGSPVAPVLGGTRDQLADTRRRVAAVVARRWLADGLNSEVDGDALVRDLAAEVERIATERAADALEQAADGVPRWSSAVIAKWLRDRAAALRAATETPR